MVQTLIIRSKEFSLKHHRSMTLNFKDVRIRKLELEARNLLLQGGEKNKDKYINIGKEEA